MTRLLLPIVSASVSLWLTVGSALVGYAAGEQATSALPVTSNYFRSEPDQRVPAPDDSNKPGLQPDRMLVDDRFITTAMTAATPPAGWLTGEGYPEPRNFIEAQWHEAPDGNLDRASHIHLGAALPRVVRGLVRLDVRVQHFHFQGGTFDSIRKVVVRTPQYVRKVMPAPKKPTKMGLYQIPITEHLQETYVPVDLDFRSVLEDGWFLMEIDASTRRRDGRMVNVRLQTKVYIANNGTVPDRTVNHAAVETWLSTTAMFRNTFGYLRVEANGLRRFASDPEVEPTVKVKGRLDQQHTLLATVNPDLHRHPPSYGQVMVDQFVGPVTPKKTPLTLFTPALSPGDRFMLRFGAFDPVEGAGASLILVRVGQD